jgi:hypothetical protein
MNGYGTPAASDSLSALLIIGCMFAHLALIAGIASPHRLYVDLFPTGSVTLSPHVTHALPSANHLHASTVVVHI